MERKESQFSLTEGLNLVLASPSPPSFHQILLFLVVHFLFTSWLVQDSHSWYPVLLHSPNMSTPNELSSLYFLLKCLTSFHYFSHHFISDSVFSRNSSVPPLSASISTVAIPLLSFFSILHASYPYIRILLQWHYNFCIFCF